MEQSFSWRTLLNVKRLYWQRNILLLYANREMDLYVREGGMTDGKKVSSSSLCFIGRRDVNPSHDMFVCRTQSRINSRQTEQEK